MRGMAVNELNCLMSIIERYEGQVKQKGWGRLVVLEHFYKAYNEMLENIQEIERLGVANSVEVYVRSDNPNRPIRIYSTKNREFKDVKTAVIAGRNRDMQIAKQYYETVFSKRKPESIGLQEKAEILAKIVQIYTREKQSEREITI